MSWFKPRPSKIGPMPGEHAEASANPGGWVYRIGGDYDPNGFVPLEAIQGAWKVDENGKITGDFIPNPKFQTRGS